MSEITECYDRFYCEDCGAAFGIVTKIMTSSHIVNLIDPTNENWDGHCVNEDCHSPAIYRDIEAEEY